ncbi:uncharacterized protein V6R79_005168 [Siganus canaliculatus]
MGNQEVRQKKPATLSGDGSYPSLDEGWKEGGEEGTKKGGKKTGKHGGKGAGSSGGGVHVTAPGKKKCKSDPKSSVFSIRKRKSNLKGKGDGCSSVTGSKENVLMQHNNLDTVKSSVDELRQLDTETTLQRKETIRPQKRNDNGKEQKQEMVQQKASAAATSPTDDRGQKGGSSGSDTDIYSFHSAADNEDLLADIQLAIRLQHQQQHGAADSVVETQKGGDMDFELRGQEGRRKRSYGVLKLPPAEVLALTPELELGSDALSFLEKRMLSDSVKDVDSPAVPHIHLDERRDEKEEVGHLELNGTGQREREGGGSFCVASGTKGQHAWLPQPPYKDITIATARGEEASSVTMSTSGNWSLDVTFDRTGKSSGEEEAGGDEQVCEVNIDLRSQIKDSNITAEPEHHERLSSRKMFEAGQGFFGSSSDSLEDSLSAGSETNHSAPLGMSVFSANQQSRNSCMCFNPLPPQESPTFAKRLLKSTHSSTASSSPGVKPYPPIFPSYIKTTTRQLSSPGHSPVLSPSNSPLLFQRAHLHRYLCYTTSLYYIIL